MEKYIEGQKITPEEIKAGIRKGTVTNKLVPVLCGSAFKNKGVQPLMDAVVDYLPSPAGCRAGRGRQTRRLASRITRDAVRQRAVRRAGVQDHDRSVCRQAHLLPGLQRHALEGLVRL